MTETVCELTDQSLVERRRFRRVGTVKKAVIAYDDERIAYICSILNVSASGALIRLEELALLPDEVTLIIPGENFFASCDVAWARGTAYGLRFVDGPYILVGDTICPLTEHDDSENMVRDEAVVRYWPATM